MLARFGPALLDAGAGRWEVAIAELEGLSWASEERGLYVAGLAPSLELADALARVGREEEAEAILDAFEGSEIAAVPLQAALAARCRALLAEPDGFESLFEEALERHPEDAYPFEAARTRLAFGERLRRAGRRVDARERLRRALAGFEWLGAAAWAEQARQELAASGETHQRRDVESRDALSPRELQVADQVAQGRTNKQVAAALFLSPKTVEYHLKHIYGKLGIGSRGELIRLFALDAPPPA